MEIYLSQNEQQTGPHTESEVQAMLAAREIDRSCPAWREGMPGWLPLEEVVTSTARPPRPPLPPGLPPVPVRHRSGFDWKDRIEYFKQRLEHFDATKLGSAGQRHAQKALPIIGGIFLLLLKWSCNHR